MSFASLQICNSFSSHFPPKSMLCSVHDMVLQLLLPEESQTTHKTRRKCQWGKLILMRRKENAQRQKSKPACVVSGNHLVLWDIQKTHPGKLSHTCTFLELSLKLFLLKSSLTQLNMDILNDLSQFCLPAKT